RVHVLKAPTGAGKTTRTMRYIAGDSRTFDGGGLTPPADEEGVGPVLFLLPTYNNIKELRARAEAMNLDPEASDEDLVAGAELRGIMTAQQAEKEIALLREEAENGGLETMVYKGK